MNNVNHLFLCLLTGRLLLLLLSCWHIPVSLALLPPPVGRRNNVRRLAGTVYSCLPVRVLVRPRAHAHEQRIEGPVALERLFCRFTSV